MTYLQLSDLADPVTPVTIDDSTITHMVNEVLEMVEEDTELILAHATPLVALEYLAVILEQLTNLGHALSEMRPDAEQWQ